MTSTIHNKRTSAVIKLTENTNDNSFLTTCASTFKSRVLVQLELFGPKDPQLIAQPVRAGDDELSGAPKVRHDSCRPFRASEHWEGGVPRPPRQRRT
jgi:hypothetical protein